MKKLLFVLWLVLIAAGAFLGAMWGAQAAKADTEDLWTCPSGVSAVATPDTSCPFADNVRQAWYNQPGRTVYAYSPVTGKVYPMTCDPAVTSSWGEAKRCFGMSPGGDYLVVYVD